MKRIGELSKMVIAKVDGQVLAGGVGLMAACDYVVASPRSTFALPERSGASCPLSSVLILSGGPAIGRHTR